MAVLLVAADHIALAGRTMSRCYDLILRYGEGQVEIADLKLQASGAVWARLLGVEDAGYDNKATEPPAG
ncbi:hypothetical protein LHFGNBLO_002757 [Mesorhizobium sp. AR10]|uniref:hypothetical protein n=1 Tax=Mesorhizobium sp. AR10 TaxID=2865839 RepID=UPI00215E0B96|nr:hypothetical protein [Mesorhizobium sp. AR10]UVK41188.1 hypothetical protein LHFGNBLO_002757 [Mesorhizobium sp. AR10]